MHIQIFDTTLRDGEQSASVNFTNEDKLKIISFLSELRIPYIEVGMITSDIDESFLGRAIHTAEGKSSIVIFGSTCHVGTKPEDNPNLVRMADSDIEFCSVVGKSSSFQVRHVLGTDTDENLRMIYDSVNYLTKAGKKVLFDCEHFFNGYREDSIYALKTIETAFSAGAFNCTLCDTNGGVMPEEISKTVSEVKKAFPDRSIGIHSHNDLGMAVAATVMAIESGADLAQGTISGIGERCGNANIDTFLPILQLKMGYDCISPDNMKLLSPTARAVNEIANISFNENEPFVGGHAFTHKAGMHINGVIKDPGSFEQISPESVGNSRTLVVSHLSGRSAVMEKLSSIFPELEKDQSKVPAIIDAIREKELEGYIYDYAEASLILVVNKILGKSRNYFDLMNFKVMIDEYGVKTAGDMLELNNNAIIKISVDGKEKLTAAEGVGPVNAIDKALRKALVTFYPVIDKMFLSDFKVRVISSAATLSVVRVMIESSDGSSVWRTIGVSDDIINASWQALRDSAVYYLNQKIQ